MLGHGTLIQVQIAVVVVFEEEIELILSLTVQLWEEGLVTCVVAFKSELKKQDVSDKAEFKEPLTSCHTLAGSNLP